MVALLLSGPMTKRALARRLDVGEATIGRAIKWARDCGIWIQSDAIANGERTSWEDAGRYSLSTQARARAVELNSLSVSELTEQLGAPAWALLIGANRVL